MNGEEDLNPWTRWSIETEGCRFESCTGKGKGEGKTRLLRPMRSERVSGLIMRGMLGDSSGGHVGTAKYVDRTY